MDALTFIIRLVEALAWPVVVSFVLWHGRAQIGALLGRLEKFKGWGAEASFVGQQLDRVEATLPEPQSGLERITTNLQARAVEADLPPPYLVQDAWQRVEYAMQDAAKRLLMPGENWREALRELPDRLGLLPAEKASMNELQNLRNQVVHSRNPQITITDALRYRDIADRLVEAIEARSRRNNQAVDARSPSASHDPGREWAHCARARIRATTSGAVVLRRHYKDLTLPVVIIAGDGDKVVFKRRSEQLRATIPGSVLQIVKGAGHMVHHLAAQQVAQAVKSVTEGATLAGQLGRGPGRPPAISSNAA